MMTALACKQSATLQGQSRLAVGDSRTRAACGFADGKLVGGQGEGRVGAGWGRWHVESVS
mgnify:CR=1 FL=1